MKILLTLLITLFATLSFAQNKTDGEGRKQGPWKKRYQKSAHFIYEGQFKNDKPFGEFTYYYQSGNIKAKVKFLKGGEIAYNTMYHESSGYVMAIGKYVNKQKDSLWVYYDNKGYIKSQENYKAGKLDGQRVVYYEPLHGKTVVAKYELYTNGLRHGQVKEYYPNSKLKMEGTYKSGNLEGTVKYYYGNGKLERIERYKHAVKHGWWIFFDEKTGKQLASELFWEGTKLKGEMKKKKAAELKAAQNK